MFEPRNQPPHLKHDKPAVESLRIKDKRMVVLTEAKILLRHTNFAEPNSCNDNRRACRHEVCRRSSYCGFRDPFAHRDLVVFGDVCAGDPWYAAIPVLWLAGRWRTATNNSEKVA